MFEIYRDEAGEWRWRLLASNSKIIADSGEGYKKRSAVIAAVERVKKLVPDAAMHEKIA